MEIITPDLVSKFSDLRKTKIAEILGITYNTVLRWNKFPSKIPKLGQLALSALIRNRTSILVDFISVFDRGLFGKAGLSNVLRLEIPAIIVAALIEEGYSLLSDEERSSAFYLFVYNKKLYLAAHKKYDTFNKYCLCFDEKVDGRVLEMGYCGGKEYDDEDSSVVPYIFKFPFGVNNIGENNEIVFSRKA